MVTAKISHADTFREGDKVKVTRDIPHPSFPLSAGDVGTVYDSERGLGVCFERHATLHAEPIIYFRYVDSKDRHILDLCIPAAPTPVDVLLKMHGVEIKPEYVEAWQFIEATAQDYLKKRLDLETAKEAFENHNNSTCPEFPSKIADWREYLVWEKLRGEWLDKRRELDQAHTAAMNALAKADSKLAKALPVEGCWFKFGNLGIRKYFEECRIETRSWAEIEKEQV